MNDPTMQTVQLDEQVWREWAHKGKLREQTRGRRRRKIAGMLVVLALIVLGIFYAAARALDIPAGYGTQKPEAKIADRTVQLAVETTRKFLFRYS